MAKITPITEHFQHFLADMQESFWGDVYGQTKLAWQGFLELESARQRDRFSGWGRYERGRSQRRDHRNGYPGFERFVHPPEIAAFVPVLRTRRNHPIPCSPSMTARLKFTRLNRGSLALRAVCLRAPTDWVWGHVCPALLPRFSHPQRVRHCDAGNEPTPAAGLSPARS